MAFMNLFGAHPSISYTYTYRQRREGRGKGRGWKSIFRHKPIFALCPSLWRNLTLRSREIKSKGLILAGLSRENERNERVRKIRAFARISQSLPFFLCPPSPSLFTSSYTFRNLCSKNFSSWIQRENGRQNVKCTEFKNFFYRSNA